MLHLRSPCSWFTSSQQQFCLIYDCFPLTALDTYIICMNMIYCITLPFPGYKNHPTHQSFFYNCIHCMTGISALFSTFALVWPVTRRKKNKEIWNMFPTKSERLFCNTTDCCLQGVSKWIPYSKCLLLTIPYEINVITCLGTDLPNVAVDTNLQCHCSHPRWVWSRPLQSPQQTACMMPCSHRSPRDQLGVCSFYWMSEYVTGRFLKQDSGGLESRLFYSSFAEQSVCH